MFEQVAAEFKILFPQTNSLDCNAVSFVFIRVFNYFQWSSSNSYNMESAVCFSQYFVHKQNVRSYKNINKLNLKCTDSEFVNHLLEKEQYLVNFLHDDLLSVLSTTKRNITVQAKEDFRSCFKTESNTEKMLTVRKDFIFQNCWDSLNDIVPKTMTGNNRNSKVFRSLIKSVIYSMRRQNILISKYIEKWDFSVQIWRRIPLVEAKKLLYHILLYLIKYILAPMIALNFYVTACKVDADENKLHYFWKDQWQSFYDKKISDMIFTKVIKKCEPLSLGKKLKRKKNIQERLRIKLVKRDIPKLHLILKSNNDCRPIVRYRSDPQNQSEKYKMKDRLKFLRTLTGKPAVKVETQFKDLHQKWLDTGKPKLYFVKTDLSNAFGCVNIEKLLKILCERHMKFQKEENNLSFKKKIAIQYREMVTELRKPLLVRAGSTVYEWQDGLVQGYKYSPALSELYYSHMDDIYFADHFNQSTATNKLFARVVDDYLYITDSLADAQSFLDALTNYRNVNYTKTVVNFEHERIKFSEEITFLGYSYNTKTLEVSRASNVFTGQMCYKIAFTGAIENIQKFLENRIGQSSIQINGHIFNLIHNPEEFIWKHIFTTFCSSANKFCTILAVLCEEKEMLDYLTNYKKRVVVKLSNAILESLLRNKPTDFKFVYCINHLRHLSWLALYLCAKSTPKCSGLVPKIKDELAKTNCLFRKWQDHASGIHSNGEPFRKAVKEICHRTDLRTVVKSFTDLPDGFECYRHKW